MIAGFIYRGLTHPRAGYPRQQVERIITILNLSADGVLFQTRHPARFNPNLSPARVSYETFREFFLPGFSQLDRQRFELLMQGQPGA